MLPPVTRKYADHSEDVFFQFSFFCDNCGAARLSERYPFSLRDSPSESPGERRGRELLWKAEHDAAYERANIEALFVFNRCPLCGRRVCDSCFSELGETCLACERERGSDGT